jgi:hypothetical protein
MSHWALARACAVSDPTLIVPLIWWCRNNFARGVLALLDERVQHPPVPMLPNNVDSKRLSRVKSDTKIDADDNDCCTPQPHSARTAHPVKSEEAGSVTDKKKRLQRRRSLGAAAFMGIKAQMRSLTSSEEPSPRVQASISNSAPTTTTTTTTSSSSSSSSNTSTSTSSPPLTSSDGDGIASPRRGWLLSILNKSSERFATKFIPKPADIVQYGFFSDQPLDKLSARLMRAMDSLQITYTATSNNTRFKAKFSDSRDKGTTKHARTHTHTKHTHTKHTDCLLLNSSISNISLVVVRFAARLLRFDIAIYSNTDDIGRLLHYVLCKRKQGQKLQFATTYAQLEEALQTLVIEVDADIRALFESKTRPRRKPSTGFSPS